MSLFSQEETNFISGLSDKLKQLKSVIATANKNNSEFTNNSKSKLENIKRLIDDVKVKFSNLGPQVLQKNQLIEELKKQQEMAKQEIANLKSESSQALKNQQESERNIALLTQKLDELSRSKNLDSERVQMKVEELSQKLAEAQKSSQNAQQNIQELNAEKERIMQTINLLGSEIESNLVDIENLASPEEYKQLQNSLQEVEQKLIDLNSNTNVGSDSSGAPGAPGAPGLSQLPSIQDFNQTGRPGGPPPGLSQLPPIQDFNQTGRPGGPPPGLSLLSPEESYRGGKPPRGYYGNYRPDYQLPEDDYSYRTGGKRHKKTAKKRKSKTQKGGFLAIFKKKKYTSKKMNKKSSNKSSNKSSSNGAYNY